MKHIYNIHNTNLQEVNTAKYLGVNINNKLSWNDHISSMLKKAHSTFGFIQRNVSSCPIDTREMCTKKLVRPLVEYGTAIAA